MGVSTELCCAHTEDQKKVIYVEKMNNFHCVDTIYVWIQFMCEGLFQYNRQNPAPAMGICKISIAGWWGIDVVMQNKVEKKL